MLRDTLRLTVEAAVAALVREGKIPAAVAEVPVEISDTKSPEHGDYACNLAMVAAKKAGMNPRALGEALREALLTGAGSQDDLTPTLPSPSGEGEANGLSPQPPLQGEPLGEGESLIASVEVAGPGFLNLRLKPEAIAAWVPKVLAAEKFGHLENANPQRINVEFVSVNPNGPITIGSGRGAAFGSALSNVLQAAGNVVHREYYINDGVNSEQMRQFGESVERYVFGALGFQITGEMPYKGEYVRKIANDLTALYASDDVYSFNVQLGRTIDLRDRWEEVADVVNRRLASGDPDLAMDSDWSSLPSGHRERLQEVTGRIVSLNMKPFFDENGRFSYYDYPVFEGEGYPKNDLFKDLVLKCLSIGIVKPWSFSDYPGYDSLNLAEDFGETVIDTLKLVVSQNLAAFQESTLSEGVSLQVAKEITNKVLGSAPRIPYGDQLLAKQLTSSSTIRELAEKRMIERQRGDLEAFGVEFDTWFSEQSLHDAGIVASRIAGLKATGVADEEPYRTKLKLGKGGVVEATIIEPQTEGTPEDEEDDANAAGNPIPAEGKGPLTPTPLPQRGEGFGPPTLPSPSGEGEASGNPTPTQGEGKTLWLRSTKFGDDMDRVLLRRDGRLTYIASDVAYHENKLTRPENATKMITILGPDHHGYIGRLTAVVAALLRGPEDTPEANARALAEAKEKLEVVIYQLVRFLKDGKPAPMRKRDGNIYELRDLIDELGKNLVPDGSKDEQRQTGRDVARFFYLMRSHDTTMDFDIDLATQQSDENPVFYAQYAHARICSVIRKAEGTGDRGQGASPPSPPLQDEPLEEGGYGLLVHPRESALIKKILDLPWEVGRVAKDYGVHRLTTYAVELARTYHHFYDACRVIQPDQPELTKARLALCGATKTALHATFQLLGVSSPERLERREAATA